jgi:hypothetical protein
LVAHPETKTKKPEVSFAYGVTMLGLGEGGRCEGEKERTEERRAEGRKEHRLTMKDEEDGRKEPTKVGLEPLGDFTPLGSSIPAPSPRPLPKSGPVCQITKEGDRLRRRRKEEGRKSKEGRKAGSAKGCAHLPGGFAACHHPIEPQLHLAGWEVWFVLEEIPREHEITLTERDRHPARQEPWQLQNSLTIKCLVTCDLKTPCDA